MMIHQPSGGASGSGDRYRYPCQGNFLIRERLNELLAKHTGQPVEKIAKDTDRDNFMSAEQSVALRPDR